MQLDEIIDAITGLDTDLFEVHITDNAWYSEKALTEALGVKSNAPAVSCVRVFLKSKNGMLELHPKDNKVNIMCYCCFGGDDPNKGEYELPELRQKILELKDHYCPPFPG